MELSCGILTTRQVAAALSRPEDPWDSRRARRWLLKTGAGVRRAGRVITTPGMLADHFPEAWRELVAGIGIEQLCDLGDFRTL